MVEALSDDLNTPLAISRLHKLRDEANDTQSRLQLASTIRWLGLADSRRFGSLTNPDVGIGTDSSLVPRLRQMNFFDFVERVRVATANNDEVQLRKLKKQAASMDAKLEPAAYGDFALIDCKPDNQDIENAITARLEARKAKDWAEADRIRDELAAKGILLKDGKDPETGEPLTTWELAR